MPAAGPEFVGSVWITLSLHNQLSKAHVPKGILCFWCFENIYQEPTYCRNEPVPFRNRIHCHGRKLILNLFNPMLLVLQRFAVLTYVSFNRVSIIFHRGYKSISQVTTVLPVTATAACSGWILVKLYPKMMATEVNQSRCSNSLVLS